MKKSREREREREREQKADFNSNQVIVSNFKPRII
jgi:hypothetical protein